MVKIVQLSDLHLGHNRVLAEHMHTNLIKYFYPRLDESVDMLVISGDMFHSLLDMHGRAGVIALMIMQELKEIAQECGFIIRVLRGTFSHDRDQNQHFMMNADRYPDVQGTQMIKVIDSITVEHIAHLYINMLYMPDDLPYEKPLKIAKEMMAEQKISKVDIMVNHGVFSHMIPEILLHGVYYKWDEVKEIVRGFVLNGHIHTPSVYERVISCGSFERMAHREEEPKGFFEIYYNPETGEGQYEFIENKGANIFKTIDLSNVESDKAIERYVEWVDTVLVEEDSVGIRHIRVLTADSSLRQAINQYTLGKYQRVLVSLSKPTTVQEVAVEEVQVSTVDLPKVTEDNIFEMVKLELVELDLDVTITDEDIAEAMYGRAVA